MIEDGKDENETQIKKSKGTFPSHCTKIISNLPLFSGIAISNYNVELQHIDRLLKLMVSIDDYVFAFNESWSIECYTFIAVYEPRNFLFEMVSQKIDLADFIRLTLCAQGYNAFRIIWILPKDNSSKSSWFANVFNFHVSRSGTTWGTWFSIAMTNPWKREVKT